ncbi:MAG: dihydroneopterin aldolase [Archaeoglobi archaeon]|nr:dihydroneopterin aldolase family protein [Candidatus Mnemosynella sp.]MBC7115371.1 dihydroneopterin aldolase family protein [Candidatus Mnemosynella bozhongmuii]MDI3502327.1 dihydroneopterin aldolase [Archaeoglobi archaeon]MDK2781856.1 dihydroneopterin aldolase [Archaeoglobi archaeon]
MEERELALFEAGIKLGALYHQFIGTPVNLETADDLERAIEKSISLQPFVDNISVRIDRRKIEEKKSSFGYAELSGEMLEVKLRIRVGSSSVTASLSWDEEKRYPLMRVDEIQ